MQSKLRPAIPVIHWITYTKLNVPRLRSQTPFRGAQAFELLLGFAQSRPEGANAEALKDGLYLVHDPRLLGDKVLPLSVRPPRVLLFDGWDRDHAAMALLLAQPAETGAQQGL